MPVEQAQPQPRERRPIFEIGELVSDNYEIRGVLGSGGMGEVYEAHDRALNRRVAIKAPWPHVDPSSVRKEAQALAAIRHPCMVSVFTVGVHAPPGRRVEYVVMERVYGVSLDLHLARKNWAGERMQLREALEILTAIADGLAAVHRAGVAHRDVKPANVMLAPTNRVMLMDFGIFIAEYDRELAHATSGSPDYMAPETIANSIEAGAGHLVDVYAFGILAYELLTGVVPFQGETVALIFSQHLRAPPPDLIALRADAPPRLARLVRELLAKDPKERPTMDVVAFRLRALAEPGREPAPDEPLSVVIAEDDAVMAETLREIVLEAAPDAEIRLAANGERAIELVRARAPHLLLLDLQMPVVNGIEVCMYLRGARLAEQCMIVSVSAGAQEQDVQLLHQLGIASFVRKGPDLVDRLIPIIEERNKMHRGARAAAAR